MSIFLTNVNACRCKLSFLALEFRKLGMQLGSEQWKEAPLRIRVSA